MAVIPAPLSRRRDFTPRRWFRHRGIPSPLPDQDGTNTASETITITYSDHSLTGPYAFSYTGDNQLGFYAVAGSFVADGNGNIESGVEDADSFQTGVTTQVAITGNYVVRTDGTGSITLSNGNNFRFVLAGNQHAVILRSDVANTGSGTIDQQM